MRNLLKLINELTQDEDTKQELFLLFLEGRTSTDEIQQLANNIHVSSKVEANKEIISALITSNVPDHFFRFLKSLSDIERETILLIMSGVSISNISGYNGISQEKINNLIQLIGDKYGIKTTFYR